MASDHSRIDRVQKAIEAVPSLYGIVNAWGLREHVADAFSEYVTLWPGDVCVKASVSNKEYDEDKPYGVVGKWVLTRAFIDDKSQSELTAILEDLFRSLRVKVIMETLDG